MIHFAVIAPPFTSHVRALEALVGVLLSRGHRVTWVQQADFKAVLSDSRPGFFPVGVRSHPPGSLASVLGRAARPGGPLGLKRVIQDMAASTDMLCTEGPAALRALQADAIIADQMEAAGGLLGEALGLPYVSVACALPVNRERRLPLPVMPWAYAGSEWGERLNETSTRVYDWLMQPLARVIARQAAAFGIRPRHSLADCLSPWAQISQTTASFDFPREQLPPHFHHVGPLRAALKDEPAYELRPGDDGRALVFASLGTLQGGRFDLFKPIAQACKSLDVQLLLAHCNRLSPQQELELKRAGATWVNGFVPQRAALGRANAVVTHAGLNTVLDAFEASTPILALPIAFDQPGVAARVVHAGAGLRLLPALASTGAIKKALQRLLAEPQFTEQSRRLGEDVRLAGGAEVAADITEAAVLLRAPVLTIDPMADAAEDVFAESQMHVE